MYNLNIKSDLALLNWKGIFNSFDINDAVNAFYEYNFKMINVYCSVKKLYICPSILFGSVAH